MPSSSREPTRRRPPKRSMTDGPQGGRREPWKPPMTYITNVKKNMADQSSSRPAKTATAPVHADRGRVWRRLLIGRRLPRSGFPSASAAASAAPSVLAGAVARSATSARRSSVSSNDEIGDLVKSLNVMVEKLRAASSRKPSPRRRTSPPAARSCRPAPSSCRRARPSRPRPPRKPRPRWRRWPRT